MKKLTLTLAVLFLLLCVPFFCHAQTRKDTTFFIKNYEVLKITYKRPLLAREYPAKDTSYKVLLGDPIRVRMLDKVLTAGHLGTYTILSYSRRVYHYGSDGDSIWESWDLKGGSRAVLHGNVFMLNVRDGKAAFGYTCDILQRPGVGNPLQH